MSQEAEFQQVHVEEKFCSRSTTKGIIYKYSENSSSMRNGNIGAHLFDGGGRKDFLFVQSSINQAETNSSQGENRCTCIYIHVVMEGRGAFTPSYLLALFYLFFRAPPTNISFPESSLTSVTSSISANLHILSKRQRVGELFILPSGLRGGHLV